MTSVQWERAREITADAFDQEASTRRDFVERACGDDPEVLNEVLRLLAEADSSGSDFLSAPAFQLRQLFVDQPTTANSFEEGQLVAGRFEIQRFLGRGSMGEVYAALDGELRETVALKTINPQIASSADAIERFKIEVRQSRRISHACVCRVYDLFCHTVAGADQVWFLTMKLVDGETLGEALAKRGPWTLREALPLIGDMTAALGAAHALGIVHRDFKPSNVMLSKDETGREQAVVMDFGLALDLVKDKTETVSGGTPAYMAPEQATSGSVGFAADQFALGLVICEMLTGSRPRLERCSPSAAQSQLEEWLRHQPLRKLGLRTRAVIRRCLAFRAEARFKQIQDLVPPLEGNEGSRGTLRLVSGGALLAGGLFLATAALLPEADLRVKDAVLVTPESGLSSAPRITPDGKWMVYSSNRGQPGNLDIWIQSVESGQARRLTTDPAEDNDPTISPDGQMVAFRSERKGGGVFLVKADGTGEQLLVAGGRSPVFSPDGRWIAYWQGTRDDTAASARLYLIRTEGREPRRLATDFADARNPAWSSDGRQILFDGCPSNTSALPVCTDWWVMRADGLGARNTKVLAMLKAQRILLPTPPQRSWIGNEVIFSALKDNWASLWALRLSSDGKSTMKEPRRLTEGETNDREPSVSEDGRIVFGRVTSAIHIWEIPLKISVGGAKQITDDPATDGCPSVSRDGRWMYFVRRSQGVRKVFRRELGNTKEVRVVGTEGDQFWPIASPDGRRVVFEERQDKDSAIWMAYGNGSGKRNLCEGCSHPTSWFGDRQVFYTTAGGGIALLDVEQGKSSEVLSAKPNQVLGGADWNPENKYLLFTSVEQGKGKQVYAIPFPQANKMDANSWIPLTREVAEIDQPHWAVDGKSFYYLTNRDEFRCVWGQAFSAQRRVAGAPFPVMHYHDLRFSPDRASPIVRGLAVSGRSIYLSVGEVTDTLWLGRLKRATMGARLRSLFGS